MENEEKNKKKLEQIVINTWKSIDTFKSTTLIATLNYMVYIIWYTLQNKNRTMRFDLKSKIHPYVVFLRSASFMKSTLVCPSISKKNATLV